MITATQIGPLEKAAKQYAGNWKSFECFAWIGGLELEDPDNWTIYYTHHRDSGLLDQSNAEQIKNALGPFTKGDDPDAMEESHRHWAVGHIDGFSVRVFKDGQITEAFRTLYELLKGLEEYPILDEEHYSELENTATYENVALAAWKLVNEYNLPEDWQESVYSWLFKNEEWELENVDDQGGYPSEDALIRAFESLGFGPIGAKQ